MKVLHPKAARNIDRDLRILSVIAHVLALVPPLYWLSFHDEIATFAQMMRAQLDMRIEAGNIRQFKRGLRHRYEVKFPNIVEEIEAVPQVLVEEFVPGVPMTKFVEIKNTLYDRLISGIGLEAFMVIFVATTGYAHH